MRSREGPGSDLCCNCIVPLDAMEVDGFKKGKMTEDQPVERLSRLSALTASDGRVEIKEGFR